MSHEPLQIRNPHSIIAALETRPSDVIRVALPPSGAMKGATDAAGDAWEQVARLARERKVQVHTGSGGAAHEPRGGRQQRSAKPDAGRISAAHAVVREKPAVTAQELFRGARDRAGGKGLWLALDSLQDPQNIGAIFRTAAFFGVQGLLMTTERSAPLTGAAYDVASGGVEHVPYALQVNLQRAFEIAKEEGLWILGTSEHAHDTLDKIERDRPWLVVLGNEEKGIRRLTEDTCDLLCRIDPRGRGVTSLNVSVAAGILAAHLA